MLNIKLLFRVDEIGVIVVEERFAALRSLCTGCFELGLLLFQLIFKKWDVAFVSKPENFKIPIFGRIIRRCCFMPIDRSDPGKALSTIKTATEILQKGDMAVGVYPEGTRNRQGGLLPFHTGVFRIAQKAHAPIVVMAIHGTENIYRNVLRRRSDVYIDVVDVIPADEVKAVQDETTQIAAVNTYKNTEDDENEIDLLDMGMALLEKLPYIILCFLIGAVLFNAFAYFLIKPTYQSTAKLYVVSASDDSK